VGYVPLFNTVFRGEPVYIVTTKFRPKKLETSLYLSYDAKMRFDILNRSGVDHERVWQTGGQTDRTTFSNSAVWQNYCIWYSKSGTTDQSQVQARFISLEYKILSDILQVIATPILRQPKILKQVVTSALQLETKSSFG